MTNSVFYYGLALALAGSMALGGEADKNAANSELEAKVKALENRIQKLEQALERNHARPSDTIPGNLNQMQGFEDLFSQMQRQLQEGRDPQIPGSFNGFSTARKPRLGVEMAPATDEYRERFKNDVKEGAFVIDVVPGSPAEHAGLMQGDCITSFAGKSVKSPQELKGAVMDAPKGKSEVLAIRRGESLALKVDLGESNEGAADVNAPDNLREERGWLRRGDVERRDDGSKVNSRTEVKASALELSDDLAHDLKLSDEQHKKMNEVLSRHVKMLGDEVANGESHPRRGAIKFSLNADVNKMVDKHAGEAEKELTGTLSPEQIQQWNTYRRQHNSVSVSHSSTTTIGGGKGNADEGMGF